jgi:predicted site-specific integrase-resolvase
MTNREEQYLSRNDAAKLAGVTPRTIKRWAVAGKLTTFRDILSGRVKYAQKEVETQMAARAG